MTLEEKEVIELVCKTHQPLLKQCPFCGNRPVIKNTWTIAYWVECMNCNAQIQDPQGEGREGDVEEHAESIKRAVVQWNNRLSSNEEFEKIYNEVVAWQKQTFPKSNAVSKVLHLEDEVKELLESLALNHKDTHLEYADCFILLMGSADAYNLSFKDIVNSIKTKMEINKQRKWGEPNVDGIVKHIKD